MDKVEKGSMKEKVLKILEAKNVTDKRSQKLHWSEFLDLLNAFNRSGIKFK